MKKIAIALVVILTFMWLSGCTQRSNPTFKESDFVNVDCFCRNCLASEPPLLAMTE